MFHHGCYRNRIDTQGNWIVVRAVDPSLSRIAVGARIRVDAGGLIQHRTVQSSFGYLSAVEPEVHFGLGGSKPESIRVRPAGIMTRNAMATIWPR